MSKFLPNEAADLTEKGEKHFLAEMTEPLTLWRMLRKHGVGLYAAQMICNDVMLNGVTLPKWT